MDTYAVVSILGHQYVVKEKDELLVNKVNSDEVEYKVLLYVSNGKVSVGTPEVKDVKVTFKTIGDEKGEKIYVQKYKAKSRSRKKIGYRHSNTRVLVEKISAK